MTDENGEMIPAVVADDPDGGYVTPQFRVADGKWYVSYDNRNTWRAIDQKNDGENFFQNVTSFGVGYFTINAYMDDGIYKQDFLDSLPVVEETTFLRHVRFEKPLVVKMDGKKKLGVVLMPE